MLHGRNVPLLTQWFVYSYMTIPVNYVKKKGFNSVGQQFHQYKQNEQPPLNSTI